LPFSELSPVSRITAITLREIVDRLLRLGAKLVGQRHGAENAAVGPYHYYS
jgi:hypothetical protein